MTMTITDSRRRLGGVALIAGPALLLAGALAHPREVTDAGEQLRITAGSLNRWYVAHLLYLLATVVFVPAVLSLGRRLRTSAPRLELWGTGLAVLGLFSTAGLVAVEGIGGWQLSQISDRQAATQALDRLTHSAGVIVPFALVGLALSAGLVLLAVGLQRTATAAPWIGWTLGLGAAVLAVGLVGAVHPAFLAGVVGIAAGMAGAGLDDIGLRSAAVARSPRVAAPLATER